MHKVVKNKVECTRARNTDYYIQDKIYGIILPSIITSTCKKRELGSCMYPSDIVVLFKGDLATQAIYDVNVTYLEENFPQFPNEVKELMNITDFLEKTLNTFSLRGRTCFGSDGGTASFKFTQTGSNSGLISIYFNWSRADEMGFTEWEEDEEHIIPAVIYSEHKYYAITNAFVEWLSDPTKPKRNAFKDTMFYLQ